MWTLIALSAAAYLLDWLLPLQTGPVDQAIAPALLAAIIGGGASLLGGLFGNKGKVQPQPEPKYYSPDQLGIPRFNADGTPNPLYQFLSTGFIPGSDQPTTTSVSGGSSTLTSGDSTTTQKGSVRTSPFYIGGGQGVVDLLPNLLKSRALEGGKIGRAEQSGVIGNILNQQSAVEEGLLNKLSSMGALGSPVEAGAREALGRGTIGALANYQTQIPSFERTRANQDLQLINDTLAQIFKGTLTESQSTARTLSQGRSDTTSSSESTTQGPAQFNPSALNLLIQNRVQNPLQPNAADSLGGLGDLLALLIGSGAFGSGSKKSTGSTTGAGLSSQLLDWIFSGKQNA